MRNLFNKVRHGDKGEPATDFWVEFYVPLMPHTLRNKAVQVFLQAGSLDKDNATQKTMSNGLGKPK